MSKKSEIHNSNSDINIEEISALNILTQSLKTRYEELLFIAENALDAAKHNRFFPKFNNSNSPVNEAKRLLENLPIYKEESLVKDRDSDFVERRDKEFVYSTLFSMKYQIKDISTTKTKLYECNSFDENENFKTYIGNRNTKMLFHGTSIHNLYSISRTGLRSMSNTDLQTTGNAYGNGVYMSNQVNTALGYSQSTVKCILCLEVDISESPKSGSGGDIFVIDEGKYKLRAIIVGENFSMDNKELTELLTKKFIKQPVVSSRSSGPTAPTGNKMNKRYAKEMKEIMKDESLLDLREIEFDDSSMIAPITMKFSPPNKDSDLAKQLKKNNIDGIQIEIRLHQNWPMQPPYIRVVYPIFEFMTGHITSGGSFCNHLLTEDGWAPSCNLLAVINMLSFELTETSDGDAARIDVARSRRGEKYSYQESLTAYRRMATTHNWKISI